MNTVQVTKKPVVSQIVIGQGDIFRSPNTGAYYMLCRVSMGSNRPMMYVTINLQDGDRWDDLRETPELAAEGLEYVGRNADINIMVDSQ